LVVVNPDAKVGDFQKEKISTAFLQDKKLAAAGLTIVDFDGEPELTCGKFFNPLTFFLYSFGMEKFTDIRFAARREQTVDFISGGFIVFRKSYFQELGGYDEDYFMYVEDMDICKRIQKKGYTTKYLPFGLLKHKGQGSSSREFAIVNIYKGLVVFYKKHSSTTGLLYVRFLLRIKAVLVIFIGSLFGKKDTVGAYSKALQAIS
jgi:GT2 family glycosyltransferase